MPSPTDFNVSPYYDDFSEDKKFHRVLYRPGFAVQARELTSQQSILQGQIEKMGEHLFEQGAMVIPGNVTLDIHYEAVKLTSFTGTLTNFVGTTVTGFTSGVKGKVVKVENWGLMNFARRIKNYNKGFYIHYKFQGNKETLNEINKKIKIDGSIIRHLVVKYKNLDTEKEYFQKENK